MENSLCDTNQSAADLEIAERARKGDSEAFAELFHAHKARIYSICLRMTNNAAQAEDLTQDAFLQVFRKLSTFKGNAALSTWLHRIAVNTVLMHFRKKTLKQISLDEPSSYDATTLRRKYGRRDGRLSGSVDRITLSRAIGDLPTGYRTIFLLHEVNGYEHQEIAKMLDCSVGNSKSQLHKAKSRIREFLGKTGKTLPYFRLPGRSAVEVRKLVKRIEEAQVCLEATRVAENKETAGRLG